MTELRPHSPLVFRAATLGDAVAEVYSALARSWWPVRHRHPAAGARPARVPPPTRFYTFQCNQRARRFYERQEFQAIALGDGSDNEEKCPDILYECRPRPEGGLDDR